MEDISSLMTSASSTTRMRSELGVLGVCAPRASVLSSFFQLQNRDTRTVRNSFISNPSVALSGV